MRVRFNKAVKGDYWYEREGEVILETDSIESVEQVFSRTPTGSRSVAYVLITMKTGVQHQVYEFLSKVEEMIA